MTPPSYQAAIDQLRSERDAFKKDAATMSMMVSRLESECALLRDQLDDVTEGRDQLRVALKDALARADNAETELAAAFARFEAAEHNATPCTGAHCVPNDEHQCVVNQVVALTDKLKAQADGLNQHWQEQVRAAKSEGRRRTRNLAAMLHAHVNAIAGESL
jgi:hypothetical protein